MQNGSCSFCGSTDYAEDEVWRSPVAESVICGPDPEPMLEKIRAFEKAGFENVYLHQVGPDQAGFLRFAERELLPVAGRTRVGAAAR